jgi:hypothetical protein
MTALDFCNKFQVPIEKLKEAVGKLYMWQKLDETTQIPKNLVEELLNHIFRDKKKKPSFLKKFRKKQKLLGDRRIILTSYEVEKKQLLPNKKKELRLVHHLVEK